MLSCRASLLFCFLGAAGFVRGEVEFRSLPMLTVEDAVTRPLPLGFSSRSLLPWDGPGKPPVVLVTNHGAYFEERSLVYRAAGKGDSGKPFSLPEDFPVYRGEPFASLFAEKDAPLEPARYLSIRRADGLFDVVHAERLEYFRNVGEVGAPRFRLDHVIGEAEKRKEGSEIWIEDLDGDGVPDLLIAGLKEWGERFAQYPDHPQEKGPWSGREHPNMGSLPDTDLGNFRGYDIAGNWMGQPVRKYLWWAKGAWDSDGKLAFGPHRKVRYGETDYPVQWHNMGDTMSPTVMNLENGRFIVLMAGPDEILALPLRGESGGELRTGKAIPLLKNGGRLKSANLPRVIGIGDLNGDGRDELIIGSGANGRITVLSGTRAGEFVELGNLFSYGGGVAGDTLTVPVRIDWDRDGHPDLILGDASGMLTFWKGTVDPLRYGSCEFFQTSSGVIRHRPADGNLQGEVEAAWSYLQPEVFDWDDDGHLDVITNDNEAKLFLYRGKGPGVTLEDRQRFMLGGKPLPLAWRSRPAVLDGRHGLSEDDRPCLLFMTWDGKLAFAVPERRGSLNMESVTDLTYEGGEVIRLSSPAGLSGRIKFSVTDWDGDGKWDVLIGVQHGLQSAFRLPGTESPSSAPYWLRNAGSNSKPVFEPARMITFKDGTPIRVKSHSFDVYPTDLNDDGKPDIVFGDDEGFIFYQMRDRLKWDEPVEELRAGLAREAEVRNQPMAPGLIEDSGEVRLAGGGKSTAFMRRMLKQPFDLRQEKPVTLELSLQWKREDTTDNQGQEEVILFNLMSAMGRSLFSIGTDSQEKMQITFGDRARSVPSVSTAIRGSWKLRAEIVLTAGQPARVRVKVSDKEIIGPVGVWDFEMEGELDGVVSAIGAQAQRHAGLVSVSGVRLEAR